jgi:hypothetical protein
MFLVDVAANTSRPLYSFSAMNREQSLSMVVYLCIGLWQNQPEQEFERTPLDVSPPRHDPRIQRNKKPHKNPHEIYQFTKKFTKKIKNLKLWMAFRETKTFVGLPSDLLKHEFVNAELHLRGLKFIMVFGELIALRLS